MKNTPEEPLALTEALTSQSSCINVQNVESDIYRFYHMDVPFQVTLEYCNGSEPEDYVNVVTLSADKSVLYQAALSRFWCLVSDSRAALCHYDLSFLPPVLPLYEYLSRHRQRLPYFLACYPLI